ncbi:hypothetical protein [Rhizobium sp. FY34]|uniref:hypothetical protein n=1 Tax=Rhizobium sp. FY34 TaxID=2562309 RepID=UPI0010BF75A7|nr:hypothetical protein [Rhizobium sp. FY34]
MTIKSLLNPQFKPAHSKDAFEAAALDIYELHHDLEVLAWGCDQLWHANFSTHRDNEYLSHFPVAALRAMAARTCLLNTTIQEMNREGRL